MARYDPHHHYFQESHHLLRQVIKRFVEQEIKPCLEAWEEAESFPRELYKKAAALDILGVNFQEAYGGVDSDVFHGMIVAEELTRSGAQGIAAGLGSHSIALLPVQLMGTEQQKLRFIPPVLAGDKLAALAVTEASSGSDVASITTRATRDGDDYLVNGSKMFITSGTRADLITTAVRTGGPGHGGISLLVIESDRPGVSVSKPLKKMGWRCSDTAELGFDSVRVPTSNLIGEPNQGFKAIMHNFQAERLNLAVMAFASAQLAYEEALGHAKARIVFGKPLIAKQVIRHKLARMYARIEVAKEFAFLAGARLNAGADANLQVAIAKNTAVEVCDEVARESVQILGGMGLMRGTLSERIFRDCRVLSIGGGTNEIMYEIICKSAGIA